MRRTWDTAAAAALLAAAFRLAASSAAAALAATEGISPPAEDASGTLVARADGHYARRDSSRMGARASAAEITEAVSLYERAAREPANAEARWKLARALYFLGTYTGLDEASQRAVFARARQAGEEALAIVAGRKSTESRVVDRRKLTPAAAAELLGGGPDSAPSLFWTAVAWGQWALASGKFDAARKGAANRIRDDCLTLIALDPAFEEGGGYRILGRLHDQAPKIPFVTGWVSRAEGLALLRLAVGRAPRNFVNRQFLAEALERSGDRTQAVAIEQAIVSEPLSADHLVEELAIQETAHRNLESWR